MLQCRKNRQDLFNSNMVRQMIYSRLYFGYILFLYILPLLILCYISEPNVFAHAMIHSHDIEEPTSKIHSVMRKCKFIVYSHILY